MLRRPRRPAAGLGLRLVGLALALAAGGPLAPSGARAQEAGPAAPMGPAGPGQAAPQPAAQCPQTLGCRYDELNDAPTGYRFQVLQVCGADCTTQYWVSDLATGQPLLGAGPVRGGGLVTVGRGDVPAGARAPVRTVLPMFGAADPACCPSGYADVTYTWDAATGALLAATTQTLAPAAFDSWDAQRGRLQGDGFFDVLAGL